ncbi:hypothetical protein JP0017_07820 [Helicobacter pylori]
MISKHFLYSQENKTLRNDFYDKMRAKTIKRSLKNPFFKKNAKVENSLTP